MSDSVWPHRRQPTRLPRPWDSPGKNTGVGCHFLLQWMKVKSESEVAQSCPTLSDPMDCSLPGSSAMGFSRQEYWSGVPLPSLFVNQKWLKTSHSNVLQLPFLCRSLLCHQCHSLDAGVTPMSLSYPKGNPFPSLIALYSVTFLFPWGS